MGRVIVISFLIALAVGLFGFLADVDVNALPPVAGSAVAAEPNTPRPLRYPMPTPDAAAAERDHGWLVCDRGHWETHDGATFPSYTVAGTLPGGAWFEASAKESNAWRGMNQLQQTRWLIGECGKDKPE